MDDCMRKKIDELAEMISDLTIEQADDKIQLLKLIKTQEESIRSLESQLRSIKSNITRLRTELDLVKFSNDIELGVDASAIAGKNVVSLHPERPSS